MKKIGNEISVFLKCRAYMVVLVLVSICSYGFSITHYSIGMDDTAIPLYFDEGVAPYVGRWSFFVINKIFHIHIGDFAPWMTELLSVIILMLSVTLWCILWKRVCEPGVVLPTWSYLFAAAVFISCPLISEVFVFYLHNGICIGYGLTALALISLMESLAAGRSRKDKIKKVLLASLFLTIALGFYESFAIVYGVGGIMAFLLLRRIYGKEGQGTNYCVKIGGWIGRGLFSVLISLLLRAVILFILGIAFDLKRLEIYNVLYRSLFGDNFREPGLLAMNLKRFYAMYYVNAVVYLPITVLVLSLMVIAAYSLVYGMKKKDIFLPVCSAAVIVLPILMSIVEGYATHYRSSQYVPLICAYAVLLLVIECAVHKMHRVFLVTGGFLWAILVYNQCADMNRWFYIDYLKYQDAARVMEQVAHDLEENYDVSKPVVIGGGYRVPYSITEDACCSFYSSQYGWICRLTDPIDPHLKEKYYAEGGHGYVFAEAPYVSVLQWGVTAFDGTNRQLIEFWRMHGYTFQCVTDLEVIKEAGQIRENMPGFPAKGYIQEEKDYIIINLESK